MNQLVRLSDFRRKASILHFSRAELNQLFAVYSSRVITGEWRDYSIGHSLGYAHFCVYRSSREAPLFTVTKLATEGKARSNRARKGRFMITTHHRLIMQSHSLLDALGIFDEKIKLFPT